MKILKYHLCARVNHGTEESPLWEEILYPVEMDWNETNEEIAKKEAWGGEYTIEDDGREAEALTLDDRVEALETDSTEMKEALDMILSGVTE